MHSENRAKVLAQLKSRLPSPDPGLSSFILLTGGQAKTRDDTDHEEIFRQEANFHYLFGVREPDCMGVIVVGTGEAILFIPRLPAAYAIWMGPIPTCEQYKEMYQVDRVMYVDELPEWANRQAPEKIFLYHGLNTDSKNFGVPAVFDGIDKFEVDKEYLHPAVFESRVVKTKDEIHVLKYANRISSAAHISVMQKVQPGMMEYQMEADFMHYCYHQGGMRFESYTCICACGPNAAILHYGHAGAPNNRLLQDGEMTLNDMGCEYYCYASDITCSFPINGKFTQAQKGVYEAVLDAGIRVMKSCKPGVSWVEMHKLAERTIAEHLVRLGYIQGEIEDIIAAEIPELFMPHGLGHLMGIDTHDVGGIPPGVQKFKSLRMNRDLIEGMVLTVEPGCYFIPALLEPAFLDETKAKHLNEEKLRPMLNKGGVRIEDNCIITKDGLELMTCVPRTISEIEAVMSGKPFSEVCQSEYPIPRPTFSKDSKRKRGE